MTTDKYNYHRIQAMEKYIKELEDKVTNREMTKEEADDFGWYKRPLCIIFTDSTYLVLQSDDEGNDGGAGFIGGGKDEHTIYTI